MKRTVLCLEGEKELCALAAAALFGPQNYEFDLATDCEEVLKKAGEKGYYLILFDGRQVGGLITDVCRRIYELDRQAMILFFRAGEGGFHYAWRWKPGRGPARPPN